MADTPGKDTPSTDPKDDAKLSQTRSGPVKPPVLEGTARPAAGAGKPLGDKSDASGSTTDKGATEKREAGKLPPRPEPAPKPAPVSKETPPAPGASPWIAGLVGGVIGLGAAYGLAAAGFWPAPPAAEAPADPRLAQFGSAIPELETVTGTLQDELATLNGRVAELENVPPPEASATTTDPALADNLAALTARVDELTNAPAPAAADEGIGASNAEAISALEAQLAALRSQSDAAAARLADTESQVASLSEAASADAAGSDASARLPLVLSGLESAFAAGRPFEAELTALRQVEPNVAVPEALSAQASAGLPRPDDVARQLQAVLPDMLAGRPLEADASWQDTTLNWFRGIVAMRPSGAVDGEGPEAAVARLEAALARRDFAAAEAELSALPQPMRAPATTVGEDIAILAEAEAFLSGLRTSALAGEAGV